MGVYTDTAKGTMLQALATAWAFTSAHTAWPGMTGTSEVTGGAPPYARGAQTFGAPSAGNIHNASNPALNIPGGTTVKFVGGFSLLTGGTFAGGVPLGGGIPKPFTAQAATDVVTCEAHGFTNGTRVVIFGTQGTGLPGGLVEGSDYYVVSSTTNSFQLALTSGGGAIDLTADGAGFITTIVPEVFGAQGTLTVTSLDLNLNS